MVANKNLKQGELILKEEPILIGPQLNGPTKCFKCNKTIDLRRICFCGICDTAPICTNDCEGKWNDILNIYV